MKIRKEERMQQNKGEYFGALSTSSKIIIPCIFSVEKGIQISMGRVICVLIDYVSETVPFSRLLFFFLLLSLILNMPLI